MTCKGCDQEQFADRGSAEGEKREIKKLLGAVAVSSL